MDKNLETCYKLVIETISSYNVENGKKDEIVNQKTKLIGNQSSLDSSDLIQIIVEIEDRINLEFNSNITLTDEKAMSRSTSPFLSVETLSKFIIENL